MSRIDRFFENIKTWAAFWDKKHFPTRSAIVLSKSEQILQKDICKYFDSLLLGDLSVLDKKVSKTEIVKFCDIFCKTINTIYKKDENKFFFKEGRIDAATKTVIVIIEYGQCQNEFKPIIKYDGISEPLGMAYLPNSLFSICKKDNPLFWCQSAALNHADIFLSDMIQAGY
jgi:hypothetical protein